MRLSNFPIYSQLILKFNNKITKIHNYITFYHQTNNTNDDIPRKSFKIDYKLPFPKGNSPTKS